MDSHLVQSRLKISPESAEVLVGILLYLVPVLLTALLLWKRRTWRPDVAVWRWRTWNSGLALGAAAALAVPLFLVGIQFLSDAAKQKWFINSGIKDMFFALLATPLVVTLQAFGRGKQRWMGMLSGLISLIGLYIALLAISY